MRARALPAVAALFVVAAAMLPARAAGPVIVSGPGSYLTTYTQPATAARVGGELTYVNGDIALHDVVSIVFGTDDRPWCNPEIASGPRQQPIGQCPLFWTPLIPLGRMTPVQGLDAIAPGTVYEFYCSLHPTMRGRLVALP